MGGEEKQVMNRFYLVGLGLFLFAIVLVGKLVTLQTQKGDYYRDLATTHRKKFRSRTKSWQYLCG